MRIRPWFVLTAAALATAACSSGSAPLVRGGPTTSGVTTTVAPTTTAPTTAGPAPTTQTLTVTPASDLESGQTVQITATGFSANEALVVTECAAKGKATGPGDCDLSNLQSAQSDQNGQVKLQFTVTKGPFGANKIVCTSTQACLISVTQATPSPTQEADQQISFR